MFEEGNVSEVWCNVQITKIKRQADNESHHETKSHGQKQVNLY